jgi:hypothetical protein
MILSELFIFLRYSYINLGTWVDLPHPVSPTIKTIWLLIILFIISSFFLNIGRDLSFSGKVWE